MRGQEPDPSPGQEAGVRHGGKYGAERASRAWDAAAGTLVRRRRSMIAAMATVAFVVASAIAIMLTGKQLYMSVPAEFRFCLAAAGVLAVVNVGIQRSRLPKLTKTAAEAALGATSAGLATRSSPGSRTRL